jgi:hypothetical protein
MHATKLLHTVLDKSSAVKHKGRLNSILNGVESLFRGGKLSLTSIGRHMYGTAKVKNKIKTAYYLLSNGAFYGERLGIYRALSQQLLGGLQEVEVLVDWSPCIHHDNQILKASVVLHGRSMTLYEEVHPEKKLGNYRVHQLFMQRLQSIIPKTCQVTIITDAGFRTEWFSLVREMGWDFIGRIRSNMKFKLVGKDEWKSCLSEYEFAINKPTYRGEVLLSKENELRCFMYLYKEPLRDKPKTRKKKKLSTKDKDYRKSAHDPWLLVTSRKSAPRWAVKIVNSYRKRMKVEHEFRDTKDVQWGIGLAYTRAKDPLSLELLLLMGNLAIFLLWLIGLATEMEKKHYAYQANTIKTHRVLSLVFLGMQVILHNKDDITLKKLSQALSYGKGLQEFPR